MYPICEVYQAGTHKQALHTDQSHVLVARAPRFSKDSTSASDVMSEYGHQKPVAPSRNTSPSSSSECPAVVGGMAAAVACRRGSEVHTIQGQLSGHDTAEFMHVHRSQDEMHMPWVKGGEQICISPQFAELSTTRGTSLRFRGGWLRTPNAFLLTVHGKISERRVRSSDIDYEGVACTTACMQFFMTTTDRLFRTPRSALSNDDDAGNKADILQGK